jgi:magnesium-transporting ATPase (P-type)
MSPAPGIGSGNSTTTLASFCSSRDISKNCLLRWPIFIYWTILGVYDAMVMFFGAYFLFDNTTFTSNGQVACKKNYKNYNTLLFCSDVAVPSLSLELNATVCRTLYRFVIGFLFLLSSHTQWVSWQ